MKHSPFKKANNFIEHNDRDLQNLFAKITMLNELNRKIQAHLDPDIAQYCQVANLVNKKLTLVVANGCVATQLRFQTEELLRKLSKDSSLTPIHAIECKVRPAQHQTSPRLTTATLKCMPALSPQTAEIVKTIADSIQDPVLRAIMEKISKRVK